MGRSRRNKPKKLSHKLLAIRKRLRMSQTEMARALELKVHYSAVSNFELGTREPDLHCSAALRTPRRHSDGKYRRRQVEPA